MAEVAAFARAAGLPIHLDGARLFNAAASLGCEAADIAANVDSVMFCLSKGLCAPAGSMLAGPADFIAKARRIAGPIGFSNREGRHRYAPMRANRRAARWPRAAFTPTSIHSPATK